MSTPTPTATPQEGETVLAMVNGVEMKAVVWKIEGERFFIVADVGYDTKRWTKISQREVIEVDKSVERMTKEDMDHELHGLRRRR